METTAVYITEVSFVIRTDIFLIPLRIQFANKLLEFFEVLSLDLWFSK